MNILVTGARGFIGQHLCRVLSGLGYQVFGIKRPGSDAPKIEHVAWLNWDLTQPIDFSIFPKSIDTIIHLAQSSQFRSFPSGANDVFNVNVRATFELLDLARKLAIKQFVYASSGGVYGNQHEASTESQNLLCSLSLGFYSTSKRMSEILIEQYSAEFRTKILRIFFAYGENQQKDRLIPRLIACVKNEQPITLKNHDGLCINPIYIEDMLQVITKVLSVDQNIVLNVGGKDKITLRNIGEIIGGVLGKEPLFTISETEEPTTLVGDITLMKKLLQFEPQYTFTEGIQTVIESQRKEEMCIV